ncbi:SRPBCC family protein [Microlunatus speluncae]|uniref:SRPBCC family protein n=1 Tax=Microlunatus speluncae TaxID=2594267 RepID=UPI00126662A4|nr:SRPBCC family protein [Microlunatus speluncae]
MNPLRLIEAVERRVTSARRDGEPTKRVILRRRYPAEITDVWQALTTAERLPRWFLPITGDLKVGGRYQFEGNAGGTIETCRPYELIKVTWEYDGGMSWVEVRLAAEEDRQTMIEIVHEAPINDHWRQYGPGAAGVGWDISLIALDEHLATGATVVEEEWTGTDAARQALRWASAEWADAAIADGEDPQQARDSADRTAVAYTAAPEPSA